MLSEGPGDNLTSDFFTLKGRAGLEPNITTVLGPVQESERYIAFLVQRYNMIGLLPSDIRTPSSYNLQILLDSEMIHDEQRLEL